MSETTVQTETSAERAEKAEAFVTPTADRVMQGAAAIEANLRKLDRRQWWMWVSASAVMLMLTVCVASFEFPGLMKIDPSAYSFAKGQSIRGLIALVLVFNIYTLYQQLLIN